MCLTHEQTTVPFRKTKRSLVLPMKVQLSQQAQSSEALPPLSNNFPNPRKSNTQTQTPSAVTDRNLATTALGATSEGPATDINRYSVVTSSRLAFTIGDLGSHKPSSTPFPLADTPKSAAAPSRTRSSRNSKSCPLKRDRIGRPLRLQVGK